MDEATAELLTGKREDFRRFVESRVEGPAAAEDVLQQGLVRALERGSSLRDPERVVAWFYQLLRNAIADHHRRRGATERRDESFATLLEAAGEAVADPADLTAPRPCACVAREVESLRPAYAELLRRIDLGGEEAAAVAADLGITPQNLAVRLHRARKALRAGIDHGCGPCAGEHCHDCDCGEARR